MVIRIDTYPAHAVADVSEATGGDGDVAESAEVGGDGGEGVREGGLDERGHGAGQGFEGADDDEGAGVSDADGAGDGVGVAGVEEGGWGLGGAGEEAASGGEGLAAWVGGLV